MNTFKQLRKLGINIPIQYINGTGNYHYYDQVNDIIVVDLNAQLDDLLQSIIHEYVHHLQWMNGYRKMMIWELSNVSYNKRAFEYHAEYVCTHVNDFVRDDGRLNISNILAFYDNIIGYLYEDENIQHNK